MALHLGIGLGLDGAGWRGLADVGADQFRAGLPRAFDEAADLVVGSVEGLQDLVLAAVLLEGAQRSLAGEFSGVGVCCLVDQAGDGPDSGVAGVLAMLRALQRLTFLGSKLSAIKALTSSAPAIT